MKKLEIPYKKRRTAVAVLALLILLTSAILVLFGFIGLKFQEKVQTGSYSADAEILYSVKLLENPYYNLEMIEPGNGYITKYADSMDLSFSYILSSGQASDIRGDSQAELVLEAFYNDTDLVWSKAFAILPKTSFYTAQISAHAALPLQEYVSLANLMRDNTGVVTTVRATLSYTVKVSALVDGTPIENSVVATLIFPVTGDVFAVQGEPVSSYSETLVTEEAVEVLPQRETRIFGIILVVLFSGTLLWLLVFSAAMRPDPSTQALERICKKYGGRIITLLGDKLPVTDRTVALKSFRELLLTADELKKPIFRNCCENPQDTVFFVFDEQRCYVFAMESISEDNVIDEELAPDNIPDLISELNR